MKHSNCTCPECLPAKWELNKAVAVHLVADKDLRAKDAQMIIDVIGHLKTKHRKERNYAALSFAEKRLNWEIQSKENAIGKAFPHADTSLIKAEIMQLRYYAKIIRELQSTFSDVQQN